MCVHVSLAVRRRSSGWEERGRLRQVNDPAVIHALTQLVHRDLNLRTCRSGLAATIGSSVGDSSRRVVQTSLSSESRNQVRTQSVIQGVLHHLSIRRRRVWLSSLAQ